MKKKYLLFALPVAAVVLGCAFMLRPASSLPAPRLPVRGSESKTEYSFSSAVQFPEISQAKLYSLQVGSPEDITGQAESVLQVENIEEYQVYPAAEGVGALYQLEDKALTVTIEPSNGFWDFTKNDSEEDDLKVPENLPTDEEAVAIAKEFIEEHQLFSGKLGEPVITHSYTGSDELGNRQNLDVTVMFLPPIDGNDVYGLYRITTVIGENGVIRDFFKQASPAEYAGDVPLKTKEQVIAEVLGHPGDVSSTADGIKAGEITGRKLKYYVDGAAVEGKSYAYPIYVPTGKETGGTAELGRERQEFSVFVDAIQR